MLVIDTVLTKEHEEDKLTKYEKLFLTIKVYENNRKIKFFTHHYWWKTKILFFHAIMIPTYIITTA